MPTASTFTGKDSIGGTALKVPAQSMSRPSDFMSTHATSAHPTSAPTMRVKEVNPAPGSKTRSRIKLLQQFTRAPTNEFTTSSLHMADSHQGAAQENALRAAEERSMAAMLADVDPTGPYAGTNVPFTPSLMPPSAAVPLSSKSVVPPVNPIAERTIQNLKEQRDILQGELDMLRSSQPTRMMPNPNLPTAIYADPSTNPYSNAPQHPPPFGTLPAVSYPASRVPLEPLDGNLGAVPGTGGLVPNADTIRKAKSALGSATTPQMSAFDPNATILPSSGMVPLGMPQPPLHAPYGAFCATNKPPPPVEGGLVYGAGGSEGSKTDGGNRFKLPPSTLLATKNSSKTPAANAARNKIQELQQDKQAALDSLQQSEERLLHLEQDNKALQGQLADLQQRYQRERERADQLDSQVGSALAGQKRAEELRTRANASMESLQGRNNLLEHEVEFLQKELRQARTYMARFGGLGKDFQNATGELSGDGLADREFFEANDYYRQASEKMTNGEAGTEEEINAIVNFVLQGPTGSSTSGDAKLLQESHKKDPSKLFLGLKDPYGAGKLGQITLLNSLKNEAAELRVALEEKNNAIDGMNETIMKLSAEVARATAEARDAERKFLDGKQRHECDKVLLADAEGEVEYLRLLTGEQTDTLNRLTDEHHKLNIQVRHEMETRSALEAQRDESIDNCARLTAERDSLVEKINVDLGTKILLLEKTLKEFSDDHQTKTIQMEELQRKHEIVNARKAELEDIVEKQLAALDGTLQAMLTQTSEVARGEEARLRDALSLIGDIRRGTAAANAAEVVNIAITSQAAATNPNNTNAPPHPYAVLQHPYPMSLPHQNLTPFVPPQHQHHQGPSQNNAFENRRLSPKRSHDTLLPYHYTLQRQGNPYQTQSLDASEFGSQFAQDPPHPTQQIIPPNNMYYQQVAADYKAKQQQEQETAKRAAGANIHALGAPYASVGSLHNKDPATMEAAVTSAHAIRDAYAASRAAAQFALARYEQEASAESARERAEAIASMVAGDPQGAIAKIEAESAIIDANAKNRAHALALIAEEERKKRTRMNTSYPATAETQNFGSMNGDSGINTATSGTSTSIPLATTANQLSATGSDKNAVPSNVNHDYNKSEETTQPASFGLSALASALDAVQQHRVAPPTETNTSKDYGLSALASALEAAHQLRAHHPPPGASNMSHPTATSNTTSTSATGTFTSTPILSTAVPTNSVSNTAAVNRGLEPTADLSSTGANKHASPQSGSTQTSTSRAAVFAMEAAQRFREHNALINSSTNKGGLQPSSSSAPLASASAPGAEYQKKKYLRQSLQLTCDQNT